MGKIQANVENYTPNTEYYWNELVNRMHASEPKQTEKPAKETLRTETDIPLRSNCMYSCCHRLLILIGFFNGQPEAMPQLYSNLSG